MNGDMNPDDAWLSRLRERADAVAPAILVEPAAAVRSGRRRRTARRVGVVGGAVALGLAGGLAVQPVVHVLRDDVVHGSTAAGEPTAVVGQPSAAQIEERARSLALTAQQNAITDPPDVPIVRWVERSESPFVLADCLAEAGFPVENVSSEGFDHSLRADQEADFALASYICTAQFPALIPLPPD